MGDGDVAAREWKAAINLSADVVARWEADDGGWIQVHRHDGVEFQVTDHTGLMVGCGNVFGAMEVAFHRRATLSGIDP